MNVNALQLTKRKSGHDYATLNANGNGHANDPPPDGGHGEIGYLVQRKNLSIEEAKQEFFKLSVPDILEQHEREKKRKEGDATSTSARAHPRAFR